MIPYDKRSGKIWYNGELVDWSDVKVHVLSHGLHYASCVFEGERVYDGKIFKLAKNAKSTGEFAGATFSPDGSTLFVNMQHDGLTLAITGPWNAKLG